MANISLLKKKFDLLPIDENNWELYQRLLNLDISVYKPLMEEILDGRLDIEDTRPLFASYLPRTIDNARNEVSKKRMLINNEDDLKNNLIVRATNPDNVIKEVTIKKQNYEDTKLLVIEKYETYHEVKLTENQKRVLIIAMDNYENTDIDLYGNKEKQSKLSDKLSTSLT
jgi:hypothetical protein